MASPTLIHEEAGRAKARRNGRGGIVQLGFPHFWLLSAILGGMLALIALAFLIHSIAVRGG